MVKKIKLDFSKVEERSGWNTKGMPEGLHAFKVESVEETQAGDGTDMLVFAMRPTSTKFKNRLFPFYCKLQQNQYWKLRDLLVAAGIAVPKKALTVDPNKVVGKVVAGEVEDETNQQYAGRSTINGIYNIATLEDDDTADDAGDDEAEDEEYEADDEAEDDEDDEEEIDDERAEELEGMTLVQLRKEAKELGIATTGLKKPDLIEAILEAEDEADEDDEDEDEDDLDDEDLGDEELDDEDLDDEEEDEEEEEPAPRRRAAASKKPAAKAPAKKAAPAASGRRVKRR